MLKKFKLKMKNIFDNYFYSLFDSLEENIIMRNENLIERHIEISNRKIDVKLNKLNSSIKNEFSMTEELLDRKFQQFSEKFDVLTSEVESNITEFISLKKDELEEINHNSTVKHTNEIGQLYLQLEQIIKELEIDKIELNEFRQTYNQLHQLFINETHPRTLTLEHVLNVNNLYLRRFEDEYISDQQSIYRYMKLILGDKAYKSNTEIRIEGEENFAVESNDYLHPESTAQGKHRHVRFVRKCEQLINKSSIDFLDIGCGAGGLVFSFAQAGHTAIGIDGSDYNRRMGIGFWNVIPENYFCYDLTNDLSIIDTENNKLHKFDVISSWEMFEHIDEKDLSMILQNIKKHMHEGSYFIGSISKLPYEDIEKEIVYHVTLRDDEWWENLFVENGFKILDKNVLNKYDYVRGNKGYFEDEWDYYEDSSAGLNFIVQINK